MDNIDNTSKDDLKTFIERVERLTEEKDNILEDIKSVYAEAKSRGFDVPTIRQIIKLRKLDDSTIDEQEYLLETYKKAIGMGYDDE